MDGLNELMALARKGGWRAVVIIDQGGSRSPYVGATLDGQGKMCNQTWDTHSTPAAALAQLAVKLGGPNACQELAAANNTPTPAQILGDIEVLLKRAGAINPQDDLAAAVMALKARAEKAEAMVAAQSRNNAQAEGRIHREVKVVPGIPEGKVLLGHDKDGEPVFADV